jgi:ubiquinone/menaquinone biosynthesis C-methylase UbiE
LTDLTGGPIYALGSDAPERKRLVRQADELRAHSAAQLAHAGVKPGWNVIDLGCGPIGVIDQLSELVGPGGHVTGLDFNPGNVALAREIARERGLEKVDIVEGDARHTGLPGGSFDLVHARTLLINVPTPEGVLAEMVCLARTGGVVTVMEPDVDATVCYPRLPAWERLHEIFSQSFRQDGADPIIGRRVGELFRGAGLADVEVEARAEVFPPGHSRRTTRADLVRSMRPKIAERGIATVAELDEVDHAVRAHFDDPNTLVMQVLFVAWGRKPAA